VRKLQRRELLGFAAFGGAALLAPKSAAAAKKQRPAFTVLPISISNVTAQGGQLIANGLVGKNPFQAPLLLSTTAVAGADCPILNLELAPIHLNVLGLVVDTSAICLDITAHHGELLGEVLCLVANLLGGGIALGDILAGLTAIQLNTLLSGLTNLLNQVLFVPIGLNTAVTGATCEILHLSLGPLDLNLLGLEVELDNCANGPVTVDVTANPAGGLLGSLLCALANLLSGGGTLSAIDQLLGRIAQVIRNLVFA
jgi:hypothetical protein